MPFVNALVAIFALLMLWRHGPRALLFLAPRSIRLAGDADAPPRASGQVAAGERLEPLGFRRLGIRRERGPLGGLRMEVDAWAHPDGTCADAYPVAGRDAVVSFLTTFADGYQVATSNFQRSAVATGAGRVGGLAGATLEGALAAHRMEPSRSPRATAPRGSCRISTRAWRWRGCSTPGSGRPSCGAPRS